MSDEKPSNLKVLAKKPDAPDENVIQMMETLLEKAKAGNLKSIAIMGHYDGVYGFDHAGIDTITELLSYIALSEVTKQNFLDILEVNAE